MWIKSVLFRLWRCMPDESGASSDAGTVAACGFELSWLHGFCRRVISEG